MWKAGLFCLSMLLLGLCSWGCSEPGCEYNPGAYKLADCLGPLDCELKQNQCNLQLECGEELKCNGIAVNKETNLSCTKKDGSTLKAILSQGNSGTTLTLVEGKDICFGTLTAT